MPKDYYKACLEPLPSEAIQQHPTKKFLSTIKAYYITERLNDVFGVGNWDIVHEIVENTPDYVTVGGYIKFKVGELWSKTPPSYGGHTKVGKNVEPADGYKSAVTDLQSKCASYLGIGADVFKGKQGHKPTPTPPPPRRSLSDDIQAINSIEQADKATIHIMKHYQGAEQNKYMEELQTVKDLRGLK